MADDISTPSANPTMPKSKAKPGVVAATQIENAFSTATIETPAMFRDLAEKGISHARDSYDKMKSAAEEANSLIETTYGSATRGATNYGLKLIEAARTNTNATFDYAAELVMARSPSEVVELSTTHARKRFEALTFQMHELTELVQKVMTETAEPFRGGLTRVVKKVA